MTPGGSSPDKRRGGGHGPPAGQQGSGGPQSPGGWRGCAARARALPRSQPCSTNCSRPTAGMPPDFGLAGIPPVAAKGFALVTCMDSRIEPLAMLGLRPGDAKILRNAGARVTDDVLRSLVLATRLLGVHGIAVMQHTEVRAGGPHRRRRCCAGLGRPARRLSDELGVPRDARPRRRAPRGRRAGAVRARSCRATCGVEGWRYDVATGRDRASRGVPAVNRKRTRCNRCRRGTTAHLTGERAGPPSGHGEPPDPSPVAHSLAAFDRGSTR